MKNKNLKALCTISETIIPEPLVWGLIEISVEPIYSVTVVDINYIIEEQVSSLEKELDTVDFAISFNFSVNVAEACHNKKKPYISWIYDSPQAALYSRYARYPENYIFVFDSIQCKRLKELNIPNLYYQPLAADLGHISTINITDEEIKRYSCDISFVGQLYRNTSFESCMMYLNSEEQQEIYSILHSKCFDWRKSSNIYGTLNDFLGSSLVETLKNHISPELIEYDIGTNYFLETLLLPPAIAQIERKKLLSIATSLGCTKLYTGTKDQESARLLLGDQVVCPPVSREDMYKVFFASRINLNITLRSIEAGAPKRVLDIMGAGGLVLSNYQYDLDNMFENNKEIVLFESVEEFTEKAKFLLAHEDLRQFIAVNGYNRVINDYSCAKTLQKMIDKI